MHIHYDVLFHSNGCSLFPCHELLSLNIFIQKNSSFTKPKDVPVYTEVIVTKDTDLIKVSLLLPILLKFLYCNRSYESFSTVTDLMKVSLL